MGKTATEQLIEFPGLRVISEGDQNIDSVRYVKIGLSEWTDDQVERSGIHFSYIRDFEDYLVNELLWCMVALLKSYGEADIANE